MEISPEPHPTFQETNTTETSNTKAVQIDLLKEKISQQNEEIDPTRTTSPSIVENTMDRVSLFTDYIKTDSPHMWIMVKNPSDLPTVNYENDLELEGQYYRISTSSGSEKLQKIYIKCYKKYIFLHKSPDGAAVAYLDVLFSKVKLVTISGSRFNRDEDTIFGIRIIKDKKFEELLHIDKPESAKFLRNIFSLT